MAPRWYIDPTAMLRAAVKPIAKRGRYWSWQSPGALQEGNIPVWHRNNITLLSLLRHDFTTYLRFISFLRYVPSHDGVNWISIVLCKSGTCRRIPSCQGTYLREIPPEQWAPRDALIQSAGGISMSTRDHGEANSALGPILDFLIPGQIRILHALVEDDNCG